MPTEKKEKKEKKEVKKDKKVKKTPKTPTFGDSKSLNYLFKSASASAMKKGMAATPTKMGKKGMAATPTKMGKKKKVKVDDKAKDRDCRNKAYDTYITDAPPETFQHCMDQYGVKVDHIPIPALWKNEFQPSQMEDVRAYKKCVLSKVWEDENFVTFLQNLCGPRT